MLFYAKSEEGSGTGGVSDLRTTTGIGQILYDRRSEAAKSDRLLGPTTS